VIVDIGVILVVLIGLCLVTRWAAEHTKSTAELDEEFLRPALEAQAAERGLGPDEVEAAMALHRSLERGQRG
jgi:hypothetical protein